MRIMGSFAEETQPKKKKKAGHTGVSDIINLYFFLKKFNLLLETRNVRIAN